tara:strand:- start:381 stop:764 length:384 start_codon:yes stop_codon:yes gene_type:complete
MPVIEIQIDTFQVINVGKDDFGNDVYKPLDSSVQVNDIVYYSTSANSVLSDVVKIGNILSFTSSGYIIVNADDTVTVPENAFILFSKPIKINESSVKGYYADVTLENHSNKKAELFAISSEVVPSSK